MRWPFLLLGATLACTPATPPPAPPASLAAARGLLARGDTAGAKAMLETVTRATPEDAAAWSALTRACRTLKDAKCALNAATAAQRLTPDDPRVVLDLGLAHALAGARDDAFRWLLAARRTHRVDMRQLDIEPAVEPLRADARFRELEPTAADFADPFVEPTTLHREFVGEAANDQFGWIARSLGDVDGDGVSDFVTSAPTRAHGDAANAGRVYVYSTKTGAQLWTADGAAEDQLGTGLEAAGDVDRDGVVDVIASAPGGDVVRIYAGRTGTVLRTFTAPAPQQDFGRHVSGVGDVDGDGVADVIVGAPGPQANPGITPGHAFVYSGRDGRVLLTLSGERAGDQFGAAVSGATRGGRPLLVVGAPAAGATHTGRTYVYTALADHPAFVIDADATDRALGAMFVGVPGDVDRDGTPDVYVSDWSNAAKGASTGRVYVHSGASGARLLTLTGDTAGEGFGTSQSTAGDVDGDGVADLIVGAWQYGGAAIGAGRAYVYAGTGRLLRTFTSRIPGDTFGFDAVDLGDVNGDGVVDFLITAGWSGKAGYHAGRVFVVSSGVSRHRP